ncbi:MAG: hypothetical protein AB9834_19395 [Lentimicrobium sp.]
MTDQISLPEDLNTVIGPEKTEFAVKAKRAQPGKVSVGLIFFGTIWLAFTSIFFFAFLGPLFVGEEVEFTTDGVATVAGPGNLGPILLPALVIGLFVIAGIALLGSGIYLLFKKGGYFVGTPTRLIHYRNGTVRSIDWEQFSGDIEIKGNEQLGNLTLQMRTGRMVSSRNGPERYVPDTLYLSGISSVFEIEQVCRKRIKENDPTPPATESNIPIV